MVFRYVRGIAPIIHCFHRAMPFPRELWQTLPIFSAPTLNHVRGFGKCDSITNLEEVDLSETLRKIERYTPNSFYLLKHAADRLRR
jgi:hypothetical protein